VVNTGLTEIGRMAAHLQLTTTNKHYAFNSRDKIDQLGESELPGPVVKNRSNTLG
jgi:hypothetical protein